MSASKLVQTAIAQSARLAANLAKGIMVSPEHVDLLEQFNWAVNKHGYAQTQIDGKTVHLHVLVFERMTGSKPAMNGRIRHSVRHIIADTKLDCRIENINPIANSQANQTDLNVKLRVDNRSGVSGVCWKKSTEDWMVQLGFNSRLISLGRYSDLALAGLVATTCREARAWVVSQQLNVTHDEVRAYLKRVALAVVATKDVADYRSLLTINSDIRNDELKLKD